ncbi:unnamed protein product [Brugia timori]|uniref:Ovule protein n=1 Tax=Brugia timori TaxID=42155 RepID=A0A0R3QSW8_9BILA|nr:unnamed protein product [Brugia timori]
MFKRCHLSWLAHHNYQRFTFNASSDVTYVILVYIIQDKKTFLIFTKSGIVLIKNITLLFNSKCVLYWTQIRNTKFSFRYIPSENSSKCYYHRKSLFLSFNS